MPAMFVTKTRKTGLLCLLACLALPAAANAGAKENKARAAKTACLSGDYVKGVALLAELYVSTKDIVYLFNQGRCFEQSGRYEDAIVRFREYQRKNTDAGNAPDMAAEKHIADCQALIDKQAGAAPPPGANPMQPDAEPVSAKAQTSNASSAISAAPGLDLSTASSERHAGSRALRVVAYSAAGGAVVAGILAGAFKLIADSHYRDFEKYRDAGDQRKMDAAKSDTTSARNIAIGAGITGAALAVTACVTYLLGSSTSPSEKGGAAVSLSPAGLGVVF
jgi:hypothetical protein